MSDSLAGGPVVTTTVPPRFVFEANCLPEDRRLGHYLAREYGTDVDWCSRSALNRDPDRWITPDTLLSGSVEFVCDALKILGVDIPPTVGFPTDLDPWYHRWIRAALLPVPECRFADAVYFLKPRDTVKLFTGGLTTDPRLLDEVASLPTGTPIWASFVVEFAAEWRFFVANGQVVGSGGYTVDDHLEPPPAHEADPILADAIACVKLAGFTVDIGRLVDGRLAIVELNDGWSIGSYGIPDEAYLAVLWARWQQMTRASGE